MSICSRKRQTKCGYFAGGLVFFNKIERATNRINLLIVTLVFHEPYLLKRKGNKSEKNRVSDIPHLIVVQFSLKIMFQTAQMCIQSEDRY